MQALKGSDKQIAWATDIRDAKLAELRQKIDAAGALDTSDGPMIQQTLDWLETGDKSAWASYWIDYRDVDVLLLLKQAARMAGVI